ncbi:MAG: ATP synthase F1 subunit gamma [Bacteroidota bacterium]|nr:ATP synthase F1 subunit gamma [Bacteroidota bacterium]
MSNLKEIRTRIASVKSTMQITSAMKMVAAAKLRRAQDSITQMRPYANKLQEILSGINSSLSEKSQEENVYAQQRDIKKVLIVVITSNRGMCGAFNANIVKSVISLATEKYSRQFSQNQVHLFIIGKKAYDFFKTKGIPIDDNKSELLNDLTFEKAGKVAENIMDRFVKGEYDKVEIVYNEFKNAASQILTEEQFLPVANGKKKTSSFSQNYIFEPSQEYIVKRLVPKSLKIQFYKALRDSFASEQGARMTAMQKATENADQLLKELNLNYNKARQTTITNEILEIVSGANALQ